MKDTNIVSFLVEHYTSKTDIISHCSLPNSTKLNLATSKVARLSTKSPRLCMCIMSATSKQTRWNKYYKKLPTLDLSTTGEN